LRYINTLTYVLNYLLQNSSTHTGSGIIVYRSPLKLQILRSVDVVVHRWLWKRKQILVTSVNRLVCWF